jgi:hypothetical protein
LGHHSSDTRDSANDESDSDYTGSSSIAPPSNEIATPRDLGSAAQSYDAPKTHEPLDDDSSEPEEWMLSNPVYHGRRNRESGVLYGMALSTASAAEKSLLRGGRIEQMPKICLVLCGGCRKKKTMMIFVNIMHLKD